MSARRVIDANANRAREALRVMEDCARFVLDDRDLCARLKRSRHDLASALGALSGSAIGERDTPGDVGTDVQTEREYSRSSMRDVALAAGKRLSEALRSIEEASKTIDSRAAERFERLRYEAYDLDRVLVLAMGTGRQAQWRLCVLVTESLCTHHPWLDVARMAIEGGADCIQLREPDLDDRELLERAHRLVDLARPRGCAVVINNRPDIALLAKADGVHVGQGDLRVEDVRRIAGFDLLVGVSTSRIEEAERAMRDGADSCGVGPMFPTTTKHKDRIAGPEYMREYAAHDPSLPAHLAIGGMTPQNAGEVIDAGAVGIAVSSCVCGAEDPAEAARSLHSIVEQGRTNAQASTSP